jgi:hypothetical protein
MLSPEEMARVAAHPHPVVATARADFDPRALGIAPLVEFSDRFSAKPLKVFAWGFEGAKELCGNKKSPLIFEGLWVLFFGRASAFFSNVCDFFCQFSGIIATWEPVTPVSVGYRGDIYSTLGVGLLEVVLYRYYRKICAALHRKVDKVGGATLIFVSRTLAHKAAAHVTLERCAP